MKQIINKQILAHLVKLSKIDIKEIKEGKILADLEKILEHFEELKNIDINIRNIKLSVNMAKSANIVRNDEDSKNINKETSNVDLIKSFPDREKGFLKIPPVFE
ncbi:MAG: Asp-tRNA(Asn)/Glu-tRNA(Gln) amidotransferase subunit GatC [Patescibacteria group bacterium]